MAEQRGYAYYRAGLSEAEREAVLDAFDGGLTAVIHHSPTHIQFEAWRPAQLAAHGRAFGREWEIRWDEDKNGRYDLLISGEQPPPHLDASLWQPLPALTVDEAELIYLWGDHWSSLMGADDKAPNEWVTAQIEASLNYPVTGGGSDKPLVRVEARRYREAGVIRFTRFVGLSANRAKEANHG